MDDSNSINYSDAYTIASVTSSGLATIEALKRDCIKNKSIDKYNDAVSPESLEELRGKNTESFRCLAQLTISRSSVLAHRLYVFPPLHDPGVNYSLDFKRTEIDSDSAQSTVIYSSKCKDFRIPTIQRIMKSLTTSRLDLRYFGLSVKQLNAMTAALTLNRCVKELILEENYMAPESVFDISEMLRDNNCIEYLNLSRCNIFTDCCTELAEGISTTQNVKELDLSKNNMGSKGLQKLVKSLGDNSSIVKLDLSKNSLDEEVAAGLGHALAENETIEELNISWNSFFSRKSTNLICKGLIVADRLRVLNLAWNGISDEDAFYPVQQYLFNTKSLEHLDISSNYMQGPVVKMVKQSILGNFSLISINVGSNLISPEAAYDLAQVFVTKTKIPIKLEYLDMENIVVDKSFVPYWQKITARGKRIRVDYVLNNYNIDGPNLTKLLFDRLRYVINKKKGKRSSKEFGHFLYNLGERAISKSDFLTAIKKSKLSKLKRQNDLLKEVTKVYMITSDKLNIKQMKEDYYNLYPNTTVPSSAKDKRKTKLGKGKLGAKRNKKKLAGSKMTTQWSEKISQVEISPTAQDATEVDHQLLQSRSIIKNQFIPKSVIIIETEKDETQNILSENMGSGKFSLDKLIELDGD